MYKTKSGEEIFIIDGHTHNWDGSPANQKNVHGAQFIDCFYAYHVALSPKDQVWSKEKFDKYGPDQMYQDLFVDGPDDMAILQPTHLTDFYKNGFNTVEQNAVLKARHPDRFILNGSFDPRDGEAGLDAMEAMVARHHTKGVKLHGRVERRQPGLQAFGPVGLPVSRARREAGHQEHPRPQGADHHAARSRCVRCGRYRPLRHRLPEPELHRRALRPAAPG